MAVGKGLKFSDIPIEIVEKLKTSVTSRDGCWLTNLKPDKDGYPRAWITPKMRRASHAYYAIYNDDFPAGKLIMHSCDNPSCVNPEHLIIGDDKMNMKDRDSKGRDANGIMYKYRNSTHCKNGHEFTEENTYTRTRKEGGRQCRICHREQERIRNLKNRSGNTK